MRTIHNLSERINFSFALLILAIVGLPGCSTVQEAPLQPGQISSIRELTLFMSRTSLSSTDFEQYKLLNDETLFVECGEKKGGRFFPTIQKLYAVNKAATNDVKDALAYLVSSKTYQQNRFESPEESDSIFSPGSFSLRFSTESAQGAFTGNLTTTLDSLLDAKSAGEKALFRLAKSIRTSYSSSEPHCGEESFYGIPGSRDVARLKESTGQ